MPFTSLLQVVTLKVNMAAVEQCGGEGLEHECLHSVDFGSIV